MRRRFDHIGEQGFPVIRGVPHDWAGIVIDLAALRGFAKWIND
jgi:hypothetical protein